MSVIAWDKTTNTAIAPERAPVDGEWCRVTVDGRVTKRTFYDEPVTVPPTHETVLSKTDFKGLFTASEYRAISVLTATDDNAFQFWDMAQTADSIDMNDARTIAGLNYVSGMGAVSAPRLAVVLLGKAI